ncbi:MULTISPECIES: hypothetical protein [unclassified Crossiella]|uniref:hypothetical protein n=1 Tax=unclassified Crossiella TaxID=2620835 RepID=UPI0020005005|nr:MULTISPECIES: hypothetical protein [unclassified Crossiella]MCK2242995.1 hypothetical protein [Crossiella sp. S99.2]MCK2256872.1 hypothetical protein [Crossiella sp. S99.1]
MSESDISPVLRQVRDRATALPGGTITWRTWHCLLWWCRLGEGRTRFRARWLRENREIIEVAAKDNDLPPEVLAGVAYQEVGEKPMVLDDLVDWLRRNVPQRLLPGRAAGNPDYTSYGPMAIQVRRGAEALGYDPGTLGAGQRREIIATLKEPRQGIYVAAIHLAGLRREAGFAGELTEEQGAELTARYNGGPYWRGRQAQRYARRYRESLPVLRELLGG